MEKNINLSEDQIKDVVGKLDKCAGDLSSMCANLDSEIEELSGCFKGSCANAYYEAVEAIKTNVLEPLKKLLKSYPVTLQSVGNNMFENDKEYADKIRGKYTSIYN